MVILALLSGEVPLKLILGLKPNPSSSYIFIPGTDLNALFISVKLNFFNSFGEI